MPNPPSAPTDTGSVGAASTTTRWKALTFTGLALFILGGYLGENTPGSGNLVVEWGSFLAFWVGLVALIAGALGYWVTYPSPTRAIAPAGAGEGARGPPPYA